MKNTIVEILGQLFRGVANFANFVMVTLGIIVVMFMILLFKLIAGC